MRYKLMEDHQDGDGEFETECHRKNTKAQVEQWILDNAKRKGIEWRSGFTVKFFDSNVIYTWRNINDNRPVKVNS